MKYKLKSGVIFQGVMYRAGETIDVDDLNYAFNWLKKYLETAPELPADDLVANELPPLDEPKRRKKNDT